MLSFSGALKVYLTLEPHDMRKSLYGLSARVSEHLQQDVYGGALYVFTNRQRTRLKILFRDGTGLWVATKRLEQGLFSWPKPTTKAQRYLSMTPEALASLTNGIDLRGANMSRHVAASPGVWWEGCLDLPGRMRGTW